MTRSPGLIAGAAGLAANSTPIPVSIQLPKEFLEGKINDAVQNLEGGGPLPVRFKKSHSNCNYLARRWKFRLTLLPARLHCLFKSMTQIKNKVNDYPYLGK